MNLKKFEEAFRAHEPVPIDQHGRYAVLVPLVNVEGKLHLLYEVRSEQLKRQPGEICFPGGMTEPGETSAETVLRETWEELGIARKDIRLMGPMDYLHTYSNFTIYPYLGEVSPEALSRIKINPAEVKEWFLVPVDFFLENPPRVYVYDVIPNVGDDFPYELIHRESGYNWRKGRTRVPIYQYKEYAIWGLTARITENLANFIRPFL